MVTIEHDGRGFKMKFSNPGSGWRGFSMKVRDIATVHTVIDHYYMRPHVEAECPVCAVGNKEPAA